jgi:hypothetical protein
MRFVRRRSAALAPCFTLVLACGDNTVPVGPPLAHSDLVFWAAHPDDDMIFMQPELLRQLGSGSLTTIYATTAGLDGVDLNRFEAAKFAYGAAYQAQDWECGDINVSTLTVHHCRLRDYPVSLVDFGLPDGGIPGDRRDSLLHLVDGTVSELQGFYGGRVTLESAVLLFTRVFEATTPVALHTLDLAASHGRDHSSHLFVASFTLWAAARAGFAGAVTWNRGYNVDVEQPTLAGDDLAAARNMLGYFEACADGCAACGTSCSAVDPSHEAWLERQYQTDRVPSATGRLALGDGCADRSLGLGSCSDAPSFELSPEGALRLGDQCVTTTANDGLELSPCTGVPEQYWVLDGEGSLWNGSVPMPTADMHYEHVRCLAAGDAPVCGASVQARWTFVP